MSPRCSLLFFGCGPASYCCCMPRPTGIPACCATYQMNPEQSKPERDDPPHTYGAPIRLSAVVARSPLTAFTLIVGRGAGVGVEVDFAFFAGFAAAGVGAGVAAARAGSGVASGVGWGAGAGSGSGAAAWVGS